MLKGFTLGLVLSIFNIIQTILSVILTKRYYIYIYGYINNNPKIYNLFEKMVEFILGILFYSKSKKDFSFIPDLISKGLVGLIIKIFSIILIFWIINFLISIVLELFSFLLKTPILKGLNRISGLIFGLMEGLFIIYLFSFILSPISTIFPNTFLGEGIINSVILNYIREISLSRGGIL
jgi:uncharacterized membrane protein required for colicin V production